MSLSSIPFSEQFKWLNKDQPRIVWPSASTTGLGPKPSGNVTAHANIRQTDTFQRVEWLHTADIDAGAGAIVAASYGAHPRRARKDPFPYPEGVFSESVLGGYHYGLNRRIVEAASAARQRFLSTTLPILGSVSPSGDNYDVRLQLDGLEGELISAYYEDHRIQFEAFAHPLSPVDAVLVEAGGVSVPELIALCDLARSIRLPIFISLVVGDDGKVLDPRNSDDLPDLAKLFRGRAKELFLGLGLNCNNRDATGAALNRDTNADVKLVYPNQSNADASQRSEGEWNDVLSVHDEVRALNGFLVEFPHIRAFGSCCRSERSDDLLRKCRYLVGDAFGPGDAPARALPLTSGPSLIPESCHDDGIYSRSGC